MLPFHLVTAAQSLLCFPGGSATGPKSPGTPFPVSVMLPETPPLCLIRSDSTEPRAQATPTSGSPGTTHPFPSRRPPPLPAAVCRGPGLPQTPNRHPGSQHLPFLPESRGQTGFRRKPALSHSSELQKVRRLHGWKALPKGQLSVTSSQVP